jgi:molybdopterin synthase sulfur carrier subunit
MRVKVRLFASLREAASRSESRLDLLDGATAEDAWRALVGQLPALAARRPSLAVAVNRTYASFQTELRDDDEVVFLPPVSGG